MGRFKEGQGLVDVFGSPLKEGDVVVYPRASSGSAWIKTGIIKAIKISSSRDSWTGQVEDSIKVQMMGVESTHDDKAKFATRSSTLTKTNELVKVFSDKLPDTPANRQIFKEAEKYKKDDTKE